MAETHGDRVHEVGETLVADAPLRRIELDLGAGSLRLHLDSVVVECSGIVATNVLGPWDGTPGIVEWLRVVAIEEGATCLELRVRFTVVPRVYRLVARSVRVVPARNQPQ